MKLQLISLVTFMMVCSFISCQKETSDARYLRQVNEIMPDDPDSAFVLLEAIGHPERMNKKDYMTYVVQLVRAKYKTYQPIGRDSIIFEAQEYFEKHTDDPEMRAMANYYAGCLQEENDNTKGALESCIRAADIAKETDNLNMRGIINTKLGTLYYDENIEDSAIVRYKKALTYFSSPKDDKWIIYTYRMTGFSYLLIKNPDSAQFYNNKGLEIASRKRDTINISSGLNIKGLIELYQKNYSQAKLSFLQARDYNPNDVTLYLPINMNLSKAYHNLNNSDSAFYYAGEMMRLLEEGNFGDINYMGAYDWMSTVHQELGNFEESLKYIKLWVEHYENVRERMTEKDFFEIERKHKLAEKEKELAEVKARENYYIFLSVFCGLAIVMLLISILYIRSLFIRVRQENEVQALQIAVGNQEMAKQKQELDTTQRELETKKQEMMNLNFVVSLYKEVSAKLKEFEDELNALMPVYIAKCENAKEAKYKELGKGFEKIKAGFTRMRKESTAQQQQLAMIFLSDNDYETDKLALLGSDDLLLVALQHCRIDHKDIANILSKNPNAVFMRKARMDNKLGKVGFSEETIRALEFRR